MAADKNNKTETPQIPAKQSQQLQAIQTSDEISKENTKGTKAIPIATKNFKNLRISPPSQQDNMKCICPHYFNAECITDPLLSIENIPSTVKSVSPDSCCTYGTHYPNRIFVGHLPAKANATDLADFFRDHGTVLEGKVVLDSFGRSRRFGFVTFANHDDVQNVLSKIPIFFKGKKINVGPAVKKMLGAEFSPPLSPTASNSEGHHSDEGDSVDGNVSETIITVPPVNEPKDQDSPTSPKTGNVWLKVNMRPKLSPKKIIPESKLPIGVAPTQYGSSRHPMVNPYQPNTIFFYSPPMYSVPNNQSPQYYPNQYYAQSPPITYYENGQAYFLNPVAQYGNPPPFYLTGSLTVA